MKYSFSTLLVFIFLLPFIACEQGASDKSSLFELQSAKSTGITFENNLEHTEEFNAYIFKNFYNGGGVAVGDVNNDGFADIYFCGNMKDNQLYLGKGDFQFEDITTEAGVACENVWSSGVSMADVNGDGWLDIYVCKSGTPEGTNRHNELFINNGLQVSPSGDTIVTFTEQAEAYGLADLGLSTHAVFFDFDKDGDLDCYLLNNSLRPVGGYDIKEGLREIRDTKGGNKLYRHDTDESGKIVFTDVSEAAGIYGSSIGFGLGVAISDLNKDGWQDIFVSNDFFERDYLYLNNGDGTFTESITSSMNEISLGSMGADIADLNNDGWPEVFVTDMMPEDEGRIKSKMTFENWDLYQRKVKRGYHHQFERNVLQLNNGVNTEGQLTFSEIGRLTNTHATDWSWGALIFDMDNDGHKDIFVANGIYKDLLDQDYIQYASPTKVANILRSKGSVIKSLIDSIPSEALPNYAFQNQHNLAFENKAEEWGLGEPTFSNGSAYGDFDNDGDLDLVINNVNMPASIYQNKSEQKNKSYLIVELQGQGKNTKGLGAQVTVHASGESFYQELAPMRGFQSSVEHRLHFGLGDLTAIDSVTVRWQNDKKSILVNPSINTVLTIQQSEATTPYVAETKTTNTIFSSSNIATYKHTENQFIDFDRDRLLYHQISREGPKMAIGDVNNDGLQDMYIGGAKISSAAIMIQDANGQFKPTNQELLERDKLSEDVDALFFDANGDGAVDLYVVSGGNEYSTSDPALRDRLYINDGKGNFTKSPQLLPTNVLESTSCVDASDFDGDGDLDLFVGSRVKPFSYGTRMRGYLLENDGNGIFKDITSTHCPELEKIGMITDVVWMDIDADNDEDLVLSGIWMPITIFKNDNGNLTNITATAGLANTNGWWNCIEQADLDNDGDLDLVLANHGKNTRIQMSDEKPAHLYVKDFDKNGTLEQILTTYNGEKDYPLVLRHDLVMQLPGLKKRFLYYKNYKEKGIREILGDKLIDNALTYTAYTNESSVAINNGDGTFDVKALPVEAQMAPMYGISTGDFNQDGTVDIILGGNFNHSKPEIGIYNSTFGVFLKGIGNGDFEYVPHQESGVFVNGEIRDLKLITVKDKLHLVVAKNDDFLESFEFTNDEIGN